MRYLKDIIGFGEKIERDFSRLSIDIILNVFGPKLAHKYFIYSPVVRHTKARILWLHNNIASRFGQGAADRFVVDYLSAKPRVHDYNITLVATGVHYPSTEVLSPSMPAMIMTAKKNADRSVALVSALLERGDIELALQAVGEYKNDARLGSVVDWSSLVFSLTPRPLYEDVTRGASYSAKDFLPGQCKNRLIVMDEKLSPAAIGSLAKGAEKITLLQYGDLYGRIDLEAVQANLPGIKIAVEHGRSRIDRFQQQYFDLHSKTLDAAKALSKSFVENSPWLERFVPGMQGLEDDLVLELSDKLFFKALRIEAVHKAVIDPEFDSVVVSFGESFELFRFFFSDQKLWQSPRINGCCRSQKIKTAIKFASRISEMQRRAKVGSQDPILGEIAAKEELLGIGQAVEPSEMVKDYLVSAGVPAARQTKNRTGLKSIAFVAHDSRAYMGTSVQIATHLNERFDVDVLATQGNPASLQKAIKRAEKDTYLKDTSETRNLGLAKVAAKAPGKVVAKDFSDTLLVSVADTTRKLFATHNKDLGLRTVLDSMLTDGIPEAVLHVMGNACAIAAHFKDRNYSAVAISPIRSPRNAQFATIARAAGIPSIAIEPHCLNAAYCRYTTIFTDYAAVYSDYFAQEYDRYFGIPEARCYTFGSPRVMRPVGYTPLSARKEARKRMGLHAGAPPVIAFPTQPMPAEHMLAVWRMIIRAVQALDVPAHLILKKHPEEGPGHIERYHQVIQEEDAGNLCYVADVDIKDLLIASEAVLTCYSVTAIEAAILERNVIIVSLDGVDYPVRWDEILGVPRCTDSETITKVLSDVLRPGPSETTLVTNFKQANPELFENSTFERLAAIIDDVILKGPEGIRPHQELPSSLFVTAPFREYLV